jgi:predicted nucleic acid-binding protein
VTGIVVADTGPLIALARAGHLQLLQQLYKEILIPPAVHEELCLESGRPGAKRLAEAMEEGWLVMRQPSNITTEQMSELVLILDPGEAEAISLAKEVNCRFLLIDERKGRAVAKRRGVPVAGLAGVLLAAKKGGIIDEVMPIVKCLGEIGYRMSQSLIAEIARLAGESGSY